MDGVRTLIFECVTSVKLCHLLGYDVSFDRLFEIAEKKTGTQKNKCLIIIVTLKPLIGVYPISEQTNPM